MGQGHLGRTRGAVGVFYSAVMVGPVPTIHVFAHQSSAVFETWMLATRASMTALPGLSDIRHQESRA